MRRRIRCLLALTIPACAMPALSQEPTRTRTIDATRLSTPPQIDGRLDEGVWATTPAATDFAQFRPAAGRRASEMTEVRVAYDDEALYVGVRNRDRQPDSVGARLARRDEAVQSDWFTVLVDSYHDRRTAFAFAVNPRGVQRDFTIIDDQREDDGWNAVWEAATRQDSVGWTAEYRIPLSQLRFDAGDGTLTWGINFSRLIARTDELSYWAPVLPSVAGVVSQFGELRGLARLASPRGLELQPYVVTRAARAPGERANPFHRSTAFASTLGGDLEYGLGSGLTLSATINPDFGQVEADPAQVNLTARETRFNEKRPFFTEGTEIFGMGFPQLFYSRRIGAAPRGRVSGAATFSDVPERTTILGAVKLAGKVANGWSVGILDAVTASEDARWADTSGAGLRGTTRVEPLTNFLAARAVRDFRLGASALGALATSVARESQTAISGPRASRAQVAGIDGRHRFLGNNYELSAAALGSHLSGSATAIGALQRNATHGFDRPDAAHLDYDSTRTSLDGYLARGSISKVGGGGWRWQVGGYAMSPGFDANDMGFVPEADRIRQWIDGSHRSLQPGRLFRRYIVQFGEAAAWTYGGERADFNTHFRAQGQLHNHASVQLFASHWGSAMNTSILRGGGGLMEQAGTSVSLEFESDSRRSMQIALNGQWWIEHGTDGGGISIEPTISVRPTTQMDLSAAASFSLDRKPAQYIGGFPVGDRREFLVGHLDQATSTLTLRANYTFAPDLSFQLYAQPFISAGRFTTFRTVVNARTSHFGRQYRTLTPAELGAADESGARAVDLDGDDVAEFRFANPDFGVKHFNSTAVLRWEYRPGSTVFVVWGHGRSHVSADGRAHLRRDALDLLAAPGTNVLMIKASYWLGL